MSNLLGGCTELACSLSNVCDGNIAQSIVNTCCDKLVDAIHRSSSMTVARSSHDQGHGKKQLRRTPWWSPLCTVARDRCRFWRCLWLQNNREKNCCIYEIYKFTKKVYRNARREAFRNHQQSNFANLTNLFKYGNSKKFWNAVRAQKNNTQCSNDDIDIDSLHKYYAEKFSDCTNIKSDTVVAAEEAVYNNYINTKSVLMSRKMFCINRVCKYIKKLKMGRAPGHDGVTPEHLKYALETDLPKILCNILNTCVKFGIVPDLFRFGVLIPVIKKPNLNPTVPGNYRPIILSSIFTKILELAMLSSCSDHDFHDLQFGFVEGRSTSMAICTTRDIISYVNSKGSQVCVCTLDAENAFDGVPHSILLYKSMQILPDFWWRILYTWYKDMHVVVGMEKFLLQYILGRAQDRVV